MSSASRTSSSSVYAVYVLTKGGVCLFSKAYRGALLNADLLSGFLSALDGFATEATGRNLKTVLMGDMALHSADFDTFYVVAMTESSHSIRSLIDDVGLLFMQHYGFMLKEWKGDRGDFLEFETALDELIGDQSRIEGSDILADPEKALDSLSIIQLPSSELQLVATGLLGVREGTVEQIGEEVHIPNLEEVKGLLEELVRMNFVGKKRKQRMTYYFIK